MHVPVVVYADSESVLKPVFEKKKNTVLYQKHIPGGFGFHLVSPFKKFNPVLVKGAENLPNKFVKKLIEEIKTAHLGLKKEKIRQRLGKLQKIKDLLALSKRI